MSLQVRPLGLDGVFEIVPPKHGDNRGFFSEVWNAAGLAAAGVELAFVQDNHSYSAAAGVMRGLHYQLAPFAQDKLVRVTRGAIFDVAVDLRRGSPTFAQWVGLEVSAAKWNQFLIPAGFGHAYLTLAPDTEVLYKVSRPYSAAHDRAIRFDDPDVAIAWPGTTAEFQLSDKDRKAPPLKDAELFTL
jgi:dTDP-4-dehydrorhamnose 3,5-epimerase